MANKKNNEELVSLEAQAKGKKAVKKEKEEQVEVKRSSKAKSNAKKVKKNKKSLVKRIREVFSELKKVSWPTWNKILKQTGVVLGVVLCFLVIIGLADFLLTTLAGLLV